MIFTKIHAVKKTNSNKSNNFTSLNMCFLLSYSLSKRLHANPPRSDFSIDLQHDNNNNNNDNNNNNNNNNNDIPPKLLSM